MQTMTVDGVPVEVRSAEALQQLRREWAALLGDVLQRESSLRHKPCGANATKSI